MSLWNPLWLPTFVNAARYKLQLYLICVIGLPGKFRFVTSLCSIYMSRIFYYAITKIRLHCLPYSRLKIKSTVVRPHLNVEMFISSLCIVRFTAPNELITFDYYNNIAIRHSLNGRRMLPQRSASAFNKSNLNGLEKIADQFVENK